MKMKSLLYCRSILMMFVSVCLSQSPLDIQGSWVTYDDKDGRATSVVALTAIHDTLFGIIDSLIVAPNKNPNPLCIHCQGDKKNMPILKMQILSNMRPKGKEWSGGKILDPKNGKFYRCIIRMKNSDTIVVRGYIGCSIIGRSQEWKRFK
jgi:hypothetical protein